MQIKVIYTNEIDTNILDENFYLTLLKNIIKITNGLGLRRALVLIQE